MGSLKLAYAPSTLAAAFRSGLFSFFSAKLGSVWPKPAPDRAKAGRSPPGVETGQNRPPGGEQGALRGFAGRLAVSGFLSAGRNARDAKFR